MSTAETVFELISHGEAGGPAILAPDRAPLTFGALKNLIEKTIASLNSFGVGHGDRVAIVLPNGPEMATAFLAVAAGAVTVGQYTGSDGTGGSGSGGAGGGEGGGACWSHSRGT